ncbi:MAG: glycosyltransferase [Myxococcota bacterium]
MRALFTSIPTSGHVHPLLPLADALREAGHEVAFACAPSLRPSVAAYGFESFGVSLNRDGDGNAEFDALKKKARALKPGFELDKLGIADVIYGVRTRQMLPGLLEVGKSFAPDLFVHECFEAGAAIVGDRLGIPHVSVDIMPLFDRQPMQSAIDAELARARAMVDLPPDPEMLTRGLVLSFVPPGLLDPELPRPEHLELLRPTFFDRSGDEGLPAWFENRPDRPLVYVTVGTVANRWRSDAGSLMQTIIDGLRDEPIEVVATIGREGNPEDLGPQPDNVHIERYIPQSLLLPHCDVCVSHAGFSTLLSSIDNGIPQLLVPQLVDDPFNAARCQAVGIGLNEDPSTLTSDRVRTAARRLLDEPSFRREAQAMQTQMHELPGLDHAVRRLESLAATGSLG